MTSNKTEKFIDKVKILGYIADIKSIPSLTLNTDEAKQLFSRIIKYIDTLEMTVNEEITKL